MPRASTSVRPATPSDIDAVCTFGVEVIPAHYAPLIGEVAAHAQVAMWWQRPMIERAEAAGDLFVVGDDRIAAVGQISRHSADPTIYKLYVRPEARGRGLGATLMAHMVAALPPHTSRVSVEHFAVNTRAAAFYEREGFTVDRDTRASDGDPVTTVVWRSKALLPTDRSL